MYRVNANVFMMSVFLAMLFYGVVMLLPSKSVSRKKKIKNPFQLIGVINAIVFGTAGLVLMIFAFILKNETAQKIYACFLKVWLIAGLLLLVITVIRKLLNKGKRAMKAKSSVLVGNIQIIYGVSTPQAFEGSKYRVAYETIVQEPEIPFITCELQMAESGKYIGDLIFEASEKPVSKQELQSMLISEVHLDR